MPSRPRHSRSKAGCFCCRLRRKKCPGEKPTCRSCEKLRLECVWPQTSEFAWRLNRGIDSDTPSRKAIESLSGASRRSGRKSSLPSLASASCPSPTSISTSDSMPHSSPESSRSTADSSISSAEAYDAADAPAPAPAPARSPVTEQDWPEIFIPTPEMEMELSSYDDGEKDRLSWHLAAPELSPTARSSADSDVVTPVACDTADAIVPGETLDIEDIEVPRTEFALPPSCMDIHSSNRHVGRIDRQPSLSASVGTVSSTLDPVSQSALQFYIRHTSMIMISEKTGARNIWKSTILQMAEGDELVMGGVLALGSIHMSAHVPHAQVVYDAATKLIARVSKGWKRALEDWTATCHKSSKDCLRLMLIGMLLSAQACLAGNESGSIQLHLRENYPVGKFLQAQGSSGDPELATSLLEHTAYLQCIACIRLPYPEFGSNDTLDLLRMIQDGRLTLLQSQESFGSLFGCGIKLYEMLPALHKFYATRDLELSTGRDLGCASDFTSLLHAISSWQPEPEPNGAAATPRYIHTDHWRSDRGGYMGHDARNMLKGAANVSDETKANQRAMLASAVVVQNVLVLFLYAAYLRRSDDLERLSKAAQPIVDDSLDQIDAITGTTWACTSWWTTIVVGSFAHTEDQRQRVEKSIRASEPLPLLGYRGLELLRSVWDGPENDFGFDGLARRMGRGGAFCFG